MSDKVYPVPPQWKRRAHIDDAAYRKMYAESVKDPDKFWAKQAKRIDWFEIFQENKNATFEYPNVSIRWFEDGVLNVSYNCIDRHLKKRRNQTAIIWEGDDPYYDRRITYGELHENTCRFANVLKSMASGRVTGSRSTFR